MSNTKLLDNLKILVKKLYKRSKKSIYTKGNLFIAQKWSNLFEIQIQKSTF